MRRVFADTLYWVASIVSTDEWHKPALRAKAQLGSAHIVTIEEVLVEFLSALSSRGANLRQEAINTVDVLLNDAIVTVMPQSHINFIRGLELYRARSDKDYSLVDCISMTIMRTESLTEVLTNDHHFTQEGFNVLISK